MPDAPILGGTKKVTLDDKAFGARFNGPLVHESVRAELNARRQGTSSSKTRAQVSGGGAKPWRQKGTGRARAGSSRSPVWTGGGVVFGPTPRSYTFKVNRKERRAALRSALSVHAERGTIAILDPAGFPEPSTKAAAALLAPWSGGGTVLLVLTEEQGNVALSFRNLDRVAVMSDTGVGIADILQGASLLVTEEALERLTARANGELLASATTAEEA
jgi:large subunit ribosomal protein L4